MKRRITEADRIRAERILTTNGRIGSIVLFLYNSKGLVDHKQLAEAIGVKKSNLSNIIKRTKKTDFIRSVTNGVNKYYFLTDIGLDLFDYIMENNDRKAVALSFLTKPSFVEEEKKYGGGGSTSSVRQSLPMYASPKK